MIESILTSIKKSLGIGESYEHFDPDIIMHINTFLMVLIQLGIGPHEGFSISDKSKTWSDFLGEDCNDLEAVKSYVYMKVKLIFDPPSTAALIKSMERSADELEWRLREKAETQAS